MHSRTELLNLLISKYNLKSYCEIGTQNRNQNFDKIICQEKYCVDIDPNAKADFTGSSDDFFIQNRKVYDLYFLDGLHHADQVKKDFENALNVLSPNGFICIHDCNPEKEEHTIVPRPTKSGHWNGDVYKFAIQLGISKLNYSTVDMDNGCGVFKNSSDFVLMDYTFPINWNYFDQNRKELLNLVSWDDFVNSHL